MPIVIPRLTTTFMTTGKIEPVKGTPLDFTVETAIGDRINDTTFVQLKYGRGYDHNWVLNAKGDVSQLAATVVSPVTGIQLDVYTSEPGMQVYTGNFLDGTMTGKRGIVYNKRSAICLESQKLSDSPTSQSGLTIPERVRPIYQPLHLQVPVDSN